MRFMMLMIPKGYEKAEPGTMPSAEAVAAMMKYNESLQKAGVLLSLEGLHPPSAGARVSFGVAYAITCIVIQLAASAGFSAPSISTLTS